jgi:hypothetical protein
VLDGVFQVFVAERHIEARASCVDPHVRRDHRLAATDRGPHRVAEHRVHASAAVFHLAVDASLFDPQHLLYPSRRDCLVDLVHLVDLFSDLCVRTVRVSLYLTSS